MFTSRARVRHRRTLVAHAGGRIDRAEHLGDGPPACVLLGPAGESLGRRIDERHPAVAIGDQHGVGGAAQRCLVRGDCGVVLDLLLHPIEGGLVGDVQNDEQRQNERDRRHVHHARGVHQNQHTRDRGTAEVRQPQGREMIPPDGDDVGPTLVSDGHRCEAGGQDEIHGCEQRQGADDLAYPSRLTRQRPRLCDCKKALGGQPHGERKGGQVERGSYPGTRLARASDSQ